MHIAPSPLSTRDTHDHEGCDYLRMTRMPLSSRGARADDNRSTAMSRAYTLSRSPDSLVKNAVLDLEWRSSHTFLAHCELEQAARPHTSDMLVLPRDMDNDSRRAITAEALKRGGQNSVTLVEAAATRQIDATAAHSIDAQRSDGHDSTVAPGHARIYEGKPLATTAVHTDAHSSYTYESKERVEHRDVDSDIQSMDATISGSKPCMSIVHARDSRDVFDAHKIVPLREKGAHETAGGVNKAPGGAHEAPGGVNEGFRSGANGMKSQVHGEVRPTDYAYTSFSPSETGISSCQSNVHKPPCSPGVSNPRQRRYVSPSRSVDADPVNLPEITCNRIVFEHKQ
jgi:hypothetical protein